MGKIFLRYNLSSVAQKVVCVVFAHSAPSAELVSKRWVLDDTEGFEKNGTHVITGLKHEMHTVKFYQSSDGVTLETDLDCSVSVDATLYNEADVLIYEYMVGRGLSDDTEGSAWADPSDEDSELHDERLAGASNADSIVHLQGFGDLQSGQVVWLEAGGFSWADEKKFSNEERYKVTRRVIVTKELPEAEVVSDLILRPLVDADFVGGAVNFGSDFYGRRCPVNYSGQVCKMVFPDFDLIPDTIIEFNTFQGNQIYFQTQFSSGDTVAFNGSNRNVLHFPKMEWVRLEWKENVCYVTGYTGRAHMRGLIIGDTEDRSANGPYLSVVETGAPLNGNIYSGIYEWLTGLPGSAIVSMSTWALSAANKKKWALDTINKTFRPPMVEGMHRRFRSGAEESGTYVPNQVGKHRHKIYGQDNTAPVNPGGAVNEVANIENAPANDVPGNPAWHWRWGQYNAKDDGTLQTQAENTVEAYKDIPLVVL